MSDAVISAEHLSKRYLIGHQSARREQYTALRDMIGREVRSIARKTLDLARGRQIVQGDEIEQLWALKDVSFEIGRGEVVGIVGRNGAGKSTLLKILSRITEPTEGRVRVRGRVASLIEVGTGFHWELTGRENIFLNGIILGMRRAEIKRRFDEIVAFAGVEKFLDTPVKRYSSGMYVRLAFAIAAHLEPEILVVDEVLGVGDVEFQKKSLGKISSVARGGRTVLFVSHNLATLETLCKRGILLESGRLLQEGPISEVVAAYHERAKILAGDDPAVLSGRLNLGKKFQYFRRIELLDESGKATAQIPMGREFRLRLEVEATEQLEYPIFCVMIDTIAGSRMLTASSPNTDAAIPRLKGKGVVECRIPSLPLAPGEYAIKLGVRKGGSFLEWADPQFTFTVRNADTFRDGWGAEWGVCIAPSVWRLEEINQPALALQID